MSISWFIAKRYIQAHRRTGFLSFITTIAILGVMLGTASLIITLSILDGFEREIKEKVVGFTSHIEVQGYQNRPVEDYASSVRRLNQEIAGIRAVSPFAAREGMIRSGNAVDGIYLKGIDPLMNVLTYSQHLVEGSFISADRKGLPQLVIGRKLANRLNAAIGQNLVVFALPQATAESVQPRAMQFQLAGIYESGMAEFDDIYAYANLYDAQKLFQMGDAVSGFDILVKDINTIDETSRQVQKLLGYPYYARTVFQTYRNLFSWVELQKKLSPLLLSLIIIVATVNIIGTLLMFVLEKTQAIGILKSLGAGPKLIQRIFTLQGLAIALVGIILGNLVAYGFCWSQLTFKILSLPSDIYYMDTVPVLLSPVNFILVTVIAFSLCMLTTLLPSRAAARLDPVSALKFG